MSGGKAYKKENRMEEKTKKRPNVLLLLSYRNILLRA